MNAEFEHWIDNNLDSQKGKKILITGGNSGIGYYTALALARAGADVIIAGRDAVKIDHAITSIEAEGVNGRIEAGIVDLASLDSVGAFAAHFLAVHPRLDVLINNAGVMIASRREDCRRFRESVWGELSRPFCIDRVAL